MARAGGPLDLPGRLFLSVLADGSAAAGDICAAAINGEGFVFGGWSDTNNWCVTGDRPYNHTHAEMPGDATLLHSIPPPSFCIPGARCLRIAGALPSPALNASPRSATSGPPRLHRPPPASAAVIRPAPHSTAAFTSLAENVAPHAATPARQRSSRRCAVFKFLNQPRRCAGGVPIAPFASVQLLTPVCPPGGSIRPAHRQLQPAGAAARRALPLRCGDDRGRALRVRWPETAAGLSALTVA